MRLRDLLHDLDGVEVAGAVRTGGPTGGVVEEGDAQSERVAFGDEGEGGGEVVDVTEDSRCVSAGCLFVARGGLSHDGRRFIGEAWRRGASVVLTDRAGGRAAIEAMRGVFGGGMGGGMDEKNTTPYGGDLGGSPHRGVGGFGVGGFGVGGGRGGGGGVVLVADDPYGVGIRIAERLFGWSGSSSSGLSVVGITGTNGKTTTSYLVRGLLNAAGVRCGLIGTVETDDGARVERSRLTTPGGLELRRLFGRMVSNGCRAVVMEVSSHALEQGRVSGVPVRVGVLTNLSPEHLDYHGDMAGYARAKRRLFEMLGGDAHAVVNIDDGWAAEVVGSCAARVVGCSLGDGGVDGAAGSGGGFVCDERWVGRGLRFGVDGLSMRVCRGGVDDGVEVSSGLIGRFNAMNLLQALVASSVVSGLGVDVLAGLVRGGGGVGVGGGVGGPPGRMERVVAGVARECGLGGAVVLGGEGWVGRSEEHTSELQSRT